MCNEFQKVTLLQLLSHEHAQANTRLWESRGKTEICYRIKDFHIVFDTEITFYVLEGKTLQKSQRSCKVWLLGKSATWV